MLALKPIIVHHMAALDGQAAAPNSLEAIRACLETQAAFIEIDMVALADTDYLLVHDMELQAETTGTGAVNACRAADARDLFYVHKGVRTSYRVPLLSEVVDLFKQYPTATHLQIDFKNMLPFSTEEPLTRFLKLIEPLQERVLVSTGADWQLRKLRRLAPWLDLGFDIGFYLDVGEPSPHPLAFPRQKGAYGYLDDHPIAATRFWPTAEYLADRCGAFIGLVPNISTFYISHRLLVQSLDDGFNWAAALHSAGIKLDAYTLDTHHPTAVLNARRLLAAGVDMFTTNTPHGLGALLHPAAAP